MELFRVELSRVGISGISCPEIGLFTLWGGYRVPQLAQLEYSVCGTWQLEVLGGGAWSFVS